MRYSNTLLIPLIFFCLNGLAQEGPLPAGGTITSNGGEVAFSLGLPFFVSNEDANVEVVEEQGLQHAYAQQIDEEGKPYLIFNAPEIAPNPATDHVILTLNDLKLEEGTYQLIDLNGRIIATGELDDTEMYIPLTNLEMAVYYLSIIEEEEQVAGFKIIKVNE